MEEDHVAELTYPDLDTYRRGGFCPGDEMLERGMLFPRSRKGRKISNEQRT